MVFSADFYVDEHGFKYTCGLFLFLKDPGMATMSTEQHGEECVIAVLMCMAFFHGESSSQVRSCG